MKQKYLIIQDSQPRFSLLQKQLIALFVVALFAFLLAFEVGLIDYLSFLFQ